MDVMWSDLVLYILLAFMIIGSIVALEVKDLLSSVVGRIGAVFDLFDPEGSRCRHHPVSSGVIILIRATLKKNLPQVPSGGWGFPTAMGVGFVVVLVLVAIKCFPELPAFGEPKLRVGVSAQHYLEAGLQETGATNLVASVILDYRY